MSNMDRTFDKILTFMESVDKRLSRLENTATELSKNQQVLQQKVASLPAPSQQQVTVPPMAYYPPFSTPLPISSSPPNSSEPMPFSSSELAAAVKMQQTLDSDAALAKKLQEELEGEELTTIKPSTTKKVTQEECPICQKKFASNVLNAHVNECLEKNPKMAEEKNQQTGFFSRFFAKKTETPAPTTATDPKVDAKEVPLAKNKPTTTTTTTQSNQSNSSLITAPPFQQGLYPLPPNFQQQYMQLQLQQQLAQQAQQQQLAQQQLAQGKNPAQTPFFYPGYQGGQPYYYVPQQYPYQQPPKK